MGLFKDCGCGCGGAEQKKKFMASLMSAFLFFIIANPETFIIVRRIFGNWVASATGYPTMFGLILHAFVFMLIVWGIMCLKRENAVGVPDPTPTMMAGGPPAAIPEGEAKKDGMLPDMPDMSQPVADVASSAPISMLLPSTAPSPVVTQGTMSKVSNMLGGHDIMSDHEMAPAPPAYGGNWRQCSCGDGTQVMILK
jgi:hypothetical protein